MRQNNRLLGLKPRLGLAISLLAGFSILTGLPRTADAAMTCGEHGEIVDRLSDEYAEFRTSLMVDSEGNLVEVYSNLETGTWTLLITWPRGRTCVVSSGNNFIDTVNDRVLGEPA